ncbi:MAG: hypothetical protein GTN70_06735 [Deltaproteobacteria bacterium]|nr:hypothetical protein [Deltaproteobacteria bacterium]
MVTRRTKPNISIDLSEDLKTLPPRLYSVDHASGNVMFRDGREWVKAPEGDEPAIGIHNSVLKRFWKTVFIPPSVSRDEPFLIPLGDFPVDTRGYRDFSFTVSGIEKLTFDITWDGLVVTGLVLKKNG